MENSELITKALNYIKNENKKSDITVDDIATHAGFSTDYFNRIFFAHTGFNIMEYVRFSRMKKAAQLLRTTYTDIIDIALDCGYEAHESFSRAFKNQYGISPSEYRKKYEKTEAYFGDFHNDTIGARLLHEFKDFKLADRDEVIDYLLETDALRFGYRAIGFRLGGGAALYNGKDFKDGFVWFGEWGDKFIGEIYSDDWDKIAEYKKIFCDERFDIIIFTLESDEVIKNELSKRGVQINSIKRIYNNIYTEKPYTLTSIQDISMRLIRYDDVDIVEKYFSERNIKRGSGTSWIDYLKHELHQRDILKTEELSIFMFGIFKGERLIGISEGALNRANGFVVNNCIVTSIFPEYETEEIYKYAFKFVTNAALEKGALPIDDVQTPNTPDDCRSGIFNSAELGYKTITTVCTIN